MLLNGFVAPTLVVLAGLLVSSSAEGASRREGRQAERVVPSVAQASQSERIRTCRRGVVANYLERAAQRCWYDAPNGRWRTLRHELHYYSLVVEVESASLADADEIARRLVKIHGEGFSEIIIYVQAEPAGTESLILRVRWTRSAGFDTLEFVGSLRR